MSAHPSSHPGTALAGALHVVLARTGALTRPVRIREEGVLRLRAPGRAAGFAGVMLNTGGGVLGGDRLALRCDLAPGADAVMTTVAADKVYRADGAAATLDTTLALGLAARLAWIPQETILYDGARLARRIEADVADDATLLVADMTIFGRLAMGETMASGALRDGWRIRRGTRLVFADETRLEGDIAAILDRPALGAGARAVGLVVLVAPKADEALPALREALEAARTVTAGAGARDGILVARLLARSPDALRAAMVAALATLRGEPLPRVWQ